jgi:hypothetical protein
VFRSPMTLGRGQRVLTLIVSVAIAGGLLAPALSFRVPGGRLLVTPIGLAVVLVLLLAWAMAPAAIVVDAGELRVERRAWRALRLPVSTIAAVSVLDVPSRGALRLFGVGGFFGSYGLFWNRALGRFRLYATRSGPGVIVRRSGGLVPIVFTPDDGEGAVRAMLSARVEATGTPLTREQPLGQAASDNTRC